jgi:hypothetical protein
MTFIKWLGSSLLGHMAGFELCVSLPCFLVLFQRNHSEWTVAWSIYSALICAVAGGVCGAFLWFVITAPQINRREKSP